MMVDAILKRFSYLPLSARVLVLTGIVTTFCVFLFAAQQYTKEKYEYEQSLANRMQVQAELVAATIAQGMWDFNTTYVHTVAASALENPDVKAVIVYDMQEKTVEAIGERKQDDMHFITGSKVQYTLAGETQELGRIELVISRERIYEEIHHHLSEILSAAGIFLLIQLLLLYAIVRHLLNPVQSITESMLKIAKGDTGADIPSQERQDEIGDMARAIQRFRDNAVQVHLLTEEINERRRVQDELVFAKEQAEAGSVAKSQFLANMSHEIRTPLNGILGIARLLHDSKLDAEQRELLGVMQTSGDLLLAVVNDILDVSKLEAGQAEMEHTPFDLKLLAKELLAVVDPGSKNTKVNIMLQYETGLQERFIGDPTKLRQALLNLLSNAVKFTREGMVELTVRGRPSGGNRYAMELGVRDTGIGIPADKLITIFDKFTQADASTTRQYGGTGLGLAIVQGVMKLLEGSVEVQSTPGAGSIFTLRLELEAAKG